MLNILSKDDLLIKNIIQTASHETENKIKLNGKSSFIVDDDPHAEEGDFVVIGDYKGIVSNVENEKELTIFTVYTNEIDSIFDRKIILKNESLISTVGIEVFISQTIKDNFTESDDNLLNIPYINIKVLTNTKINAKVDTEDGVYNLRTYLGNVKERYGIHLDYEFDDGELNITISKNELSTLDVDATIEDIITYHEVYKVDTISKITVLSKESNNTFDYFLLTDRTTTTDKNDPNRAKGSIEIVTCEEDTDAQQAALDAFKANSYQHNIELTITKDSKVFNESDFIVGRNLRIKTSDNGIYETFISSIEKQSDSNVYTVTCGNMKVTFIDRMDGVI